MKIHVGNVNWDSTAEDLKEYFEKIGDVYDAKIIYDERGKSRGWAMVEMCSNRDARQAIKDLHDTIFDARRIRVREFNE